MGFDNGSPPNTHNKEKPFCKIHFGSKFSIIHRFYYALHSKSFSSDPPLHLYCLILMRVNLKWS